jgi:hypothetical protein
MKYKSCLVVLALLSGLASPAYAKVLTCSFDANTDGGPEGGYMFDSVSLNCNDGYKVTMTGIGIAARITQKSYYTIACANDDIRGSYVGIKADFIYLAGVGGSAFLGDNSSCVAADVANGFGAGAVISKMTIE